MTIKKRSISRLIAVQTLYQYDFFESQKSIDDIKRDVIDYYRNGAAIEIGLQQDLKRDLFDIEFLNNILEAAVENLAKIDALINKASEVKDNKTNDILLNQILRFGVLEIIFLKDVPTNVVVKEYTDISSYFYDDKIVNFVNGFLANIA